MPDRNALNQRITLSMTSCTMVMVMGYGKVSRMLRGRIRVWCAMTLSSQISTYLLPNTLVRVDARYQMPQ